MPVINTTVNTAAVKTVFMKAFLERYKEMLGFTEICQKKKIPLGANQGDTIEYTRILQLPDVTAALDDEITPPDEGSFKTQTLSFGLKIWGYWIPVSEKYKFVTIDSGLKELYLALAEQAANSIERDIATVWGQGCHIGVRADGDAAYEKHAVPITAVTSATSFTCASLTEADDFWNNARFAPTHPEYKAYGEYGYVTDFASGVITASGLTTAPEVGQLIDIWLPTGLDSSDVLTSTAITRGLRKLRWNKVPRFSGAKGRYAGILDPDTEGDFFNDEKIERLYIDHASGPRNLFDYTHGTVYGTDWMTVTRPYREAADTPRTYSLTGDVHGVGIFGPNCIGTVDPKGNGLKVYSTPANIAEPKLDLYSYLKWKALRKTCGLNPVNSVLLACGATAG